MEPKDFVYTMLMAGTPLFVIILIHFLKIYNLLPAWALTQ